MSDIKVRVGQQNAIKVLSSLSGGASFSENSGTSVNVIGGIASVTQLNVSGITTLGVTSTTNLTSQQLNVSGIATVSSAFYYGQYNTGGVAYFDSTGLMVSTGSTSSAINYTNYILTTDNVGITTWSSTIDGGEY
jgi:hypothetical protein